MIGEDYALRYGNRLCVPDMDNLRRELVIEAHQIVYFMHLMHLGSTKKYKDFNVCYWWNMIKINTTDFVSRHFTYQRVNDEH